MKKCVVLLFLLYISCTKKDHFENKILDLNLNNWHINEIKNNNFYSLRAINRDSSLVILTFDNQDNLIGILTENSSTQKGFLMEINNSNLELLRNIQNKLPNGMTYHFDNNGLINKIIYFKNDTLDGLYNFYDKNGELVYKHAYKNGIMQY